MINENAINKAVLMNHFSGNSTPLQRKLIEDWLEASENVEYYYECLDEWECANAQFVADNKLGLKKIFSTTTKVESIVEKVSSVKSLSRKLAVAAVILVIIGGGILLGKNEVLYKTITTHYGEIKQVTLPDGSVVALNSNSILRYSRFNFGSNNREVMLYGEADFSVTHTKSNQKFIVKTDNNLNITVLGTQFSVYARDKKDKVVLRKGKVELSYLTKHQGKDLFLKPGDVFTNNMIGGDTVQHIVDTEKEIAWKTHDFQFEGTALSEVANMLKDDFGLNARFQSVELASRKISGSFHAEKSEELIDAIAQLLDINYKIKNGFVYFFE